MIEVKDLLSGWSKILLGEETRLELVRSVISETAGVPIKKEDIKIKNNTVFLNIKPLYKSEIFLKKERIIANLEKALGKRIPSEII